MFFLKSKTVSSVFLLFLFMGFWPHTSLADTLKECDLTAPKERLEAIQENYELRANEKLLQELGARKTLLHLVGQCLILEAKERQAEIKNNNATEGEGKAFQKWLGNKWDEVISFYEYRLTQIDSLGLKGSKDMAMAISERRASLDTPLESLTRNYLLWSANQPLFETGTKRSLDITKTIEAFNLPTNHKILPLLKEGQDQIKSAREENSLAWEHIKNGRSEESLDTIKSSLEKLAEAYKIFFAISDLGKEELPL